MAGEFNKVPLPFNPAISPTNDPQYLGLSRPIDTPEPDRRYEALFKGAANMLDVGLAGADFYFKKKIDSELYNAIDIERDQFGVADATERAKKGGSPLNAVDNARRAIDEQLKMNDPDSAWNRSLLDPKAGPSDADGRGKITPAAKRDIEKLGTESERLVQAHAAGKLSNSYYAARLESIVRAVRAQYPGYREYIDQRVAQITGMTPANTLRAQLLADITEAGALRAGEQDKLLSLLDKHRDDLGDLYPEVERRVRNGTIDRLGIMSAVQDRQSRRQRQRDAILEVEVDDKLNNLDKRKLTEAASITVNGMIANSFDNIIQVQGGPDALEKKLRDFQTGKTTPKDGEIEEIIGGLRAYRAIDEKRILAKLHEVGPTGKSIASRLGTEETKKQLAMGLARYDSIIEDLINKDYGAAGRNARRVVDIEKNDMLKILQTSEAARAMNIAKNFGPNAAQFLYQDEPKITATLPKQILNHAREMIAGQPSVVPFTGNSALDLLEKTQQRDSKGDPVPHQKEMFNGLIKIFEHIANPQIPIDMKVNIAKGAFSPENRGFINKFDSASKTLVFERMTSPGVIAGMKEVAKVNSALYSEFKIWAETEFGNAIFREKVANLTKYQADPNFIVTWDNERGQLNYFNANPPKFGERPLYEVLGHPGNEASIKKEIAEINRGLVSIGAIAKEDGKDVGAYLLGYLRSWGFNPNQPGEDVASKMARALAAEAIAEKKEEERKSEIEKSKMKRRKVQ